MSEFNIGDVVKWYEFVFDPLSQLQYNYCSTIASSFDGCYERLGGDMNSDTDIKSHICLKHGTVTAIRKQVTAKSLIWNKEGENVCSFGNRHAPECTCVIPNLYTILSDDSNERVIFEDDITPFWQEECD